jgi:Tol biopolymer transport system component/DNA-binding winged helix-turn-helix (wHTH) protein
MPDGDGHSGKIRFGAYELDQAAHELRKNGLSIRLQDQPWEVLCALLEQPGEVVSREDLRRRLWPDGTFVDYEQSLNKAVNKLREALSDSADKPRYVETLARRGYRFVAAVEAPTPVPVLVPRKRSKRRLLWWAVGATGVLGVVLVTGLWPVPEPRTRVTPLTALGRIWDTGLFVGGGRVHFTVEPRGLAKEGIWSVPTSGGEPRRELAPCPEKAYAVVAGFSYSLRQLLVSCAEVGSNRWSLWLAGFDYSNPKPVGRHHSEEGFTPSLSPDAKTILSGRKGGFFVKPVDGGEERLLVKVNWNSPPGWFFYHPSGDRIVFSYPVDGIWKAWEVGADGTGMKLLLPGFAAQNRDPQWSPDGNRLYFRSGADIYMRPSRGWLGWMRRPAPVRLTSGPIRFMVPFEDPDNPLAVYAYGHSREGELMKVNRETNAFEPYLGGMAADCLDYSPDGQWIAYVSYPDGELWKCRRDGSGKVLLEDQFFSYTPRWSPDGTRIAFSARKPGSSGPRAPFRIYTKPAEGGRPELVPGVPGAAFDATWAPDGKRVAFAPYPNEVDKQDQHVSIVNVETGEVQEVTGSENLFSPRWSPDGRMLVAISCDKFEPFVYSFTTQKWRALRPLGTGRFGFPRWSKDSRYLYGSISYLGMTLIRLEVATGKEEVIRTISEFGMAGNLSAGTFWTPDDEPVVLKDQSTAQIYRIERDR